MSGAPPISADYDARQVFETIRQARQAARGIPAEAWRGLAYDVVMNTRGGGCYITVRREVSRELVGFLTSGEDDE